MLITPDTLKIVHAGLDLRFQQAFQTAPVWSTDLFDQVPSNGPFSTYAWMDDIPRMREWLGERVVHGLKARVYSIYNKVYELTVGVKRTQLEDNDLANANRITTMMGNQAAKLPDDLMKDLLQNGTSRVCYDGQYFFDTDHPNNIDAVSGTQQNYWASGMPLTAANLFTVWSTMASYVGSSGRPIGVKPTTLLVPPQLYMAALNIVNAPTLSGGGTNVLNGLVQIKVAAELSNEPTAWYLLDNSQGVKAFILQRARELAITAKMSLDDDNVFYRDQFDFGADLRAGAGYGIWFLAAKAVG